MNEGVGNRIGWLIKELGIKKVYFAEKIKVDQSYISHLVKGKRKPSDRLIADICRVFNVNETWLRTGDGEPFTAVTETQVNMLLTELGLTGAASRILRKYVLLAETDRDVIKHFVRSLLDNYPKSEPLPNETALETNELPALYVELTNKLEAVTNRLEEVTSQLDEVKKENEKLRRKNEQNEKRLENIEQEDSLRDAEKLGNAG